MKTKASAKWLAALLVTGLALSGCGKKDKSKKDKPDPSSDTTKDPKDGPKTPADKPVTPPKPRAELPADSGGHEGKLVWSRSAGSLERDEGKSIDIDDEGNVVVTGLFSGEVDFGGGTALAANKTDVFVASYGADGAHKWSVGLGGKDVDLGKGVALDSDGNAIAVGWFAETMTVGAVPLKSAGGNDAFVVKFDPEGKVLWARKFGAENIELAQAVAVMPDKSVVVIGEFRTTVDFGGGPLKSEGDADIFLLKLGADGAHIWSKSFGYAGQDYGREIAVDSRGDIVIAAEFTGTVDFGGEKPLVHVGNRDAMIGKFDGNGKHIWSKGFGSTLNDLSLDVAIDPADNVVLVGAFEDTVKIDGNEFVSKGETDALVVKFAPDGKYLWGKQYGAEKKDVASGVAADKFGNVILTGWFWHSVDFGGGVLKSPNGNMDMFLIKLSPTGDHVWSRNFGDKDHDKGFAVAVNDAGNIALTGGFRFKLDLGGETAHESKRKEGDKIPRPDIFVAQFEH